jgi:hypothetical protein
MAQGDQVLNASLEKRSQRSFIRRQGIADRSGYFCSFDARTSLV